MSGRRSDQPPARPAAAPDGVAPYVDRPVVRVSNLYATSWRAEPGRTPLTDRLAFGRLEAFYRAAADQLPVVIASQQLDPAAVGGRRWDGAVVAGRVWLFGMPSGQVVVGLSLDVDSPPIGAVNLLEDCYYLELTCEDTGIAEVAAGLARVHGIKVDAAEFAQERHQIVFTRRLDVNDPGDVVQRLVYRVDLPYRSEFSAIAYPGELNRRPNTLAAVGPYVSVFCGQQDYVENAAFISAAQAVASSARLRQIRHALYHQLRQFSAADRTDEDTRTRRRTLEQITDDLTRLELDLSVCVEAPADLRVLVPSLRAAEYHREVYTALGMRELARTVSRMLRRLEATARAELTSIESIERRADDDRRLRWTVAIGFVSAIAIPITLILAFFGINANQVNPQRSMFDPAYTWVYAAVALLAVTATLLALTLYVHQLRQHRRLTDARLRPRNPTDLPEIPAQRGPDQT